jgi:tRNA pseudouridine55 synthase
VNGVLVVNKPVGLTSHDVVARVRRIAGEKSVGHLGTLDPMATGVLPLVLGRFTRLAQFYQDADKRYRGAIRFGFSTDTYDAEGDPLGPDQPVHLSLEAISDAARGFTGRIAQLPPPFSAKKISGVPAYKLARKGKPVELAPKQVEVKEFVLTDWEPKTKTARFTSWVSAGTYLRTLAHDLGQMLGTGAHLSVLERTAVREFTIEEAHGLEELAQAAQAGKIEETFLHPRLILPEFPAVTAPADALAKIQHGSAVNLPDYSRASIVRIFAGQRELLGIAKRVAGTLFQPKIVLYGGG